MNDRAGLILALMMVLVGFRLYTSGKLIAAWKTLTSPQSGGSGGLSIPIPIPIPNPLNPLQPIIPSVPIPTATGGAV